MFLKFACSVFTYIISAGRIIRQVVQGLLYLHSYQILHRDMSLSNLLLSRDMQVVRLFANYKILSFELNLNH